jgi:hypothetical protein
VIPLQPSAVPAQQEYRARLERWQQARERWQRSDRQLGNARLATGLAALGIAFVSLGPGWIPAWWLLAPVILFVGLAVAHDRVSRSLAAAARGVSYHERALARVENRWIGTGDQGERFRDPKHIYADDLDLFGRGSLFELLSTARTAAGHRFLAEWLLAPGAREAVIARQAAVAELRSRIDLREELALMGEDIRAAVDDRALKNWGERPPISFFPYARILAPALAGLAVAALVLFLTDVTTLRPFFYVVLAELMFMYFARDSLRKLMESVGTPSRELELLGLLLKRLEQEPFTSPALVALRAKLEAGGRPASQQIQRLTRLVHHLDSARNQFLGVLVFPLMWIPQFAMAIEAWRSRCGAQIGPWIAAVGELEALCSLASFAYERSYERSGAVFPELLEGTSPSFEAVALAHPLIPPQEAVGNDVTLHGEVRLWIVSGSNMSGKSTLLRAVGLSTVLAWAGAPVMAASMRLSRLHIGASMRANDSLADHRSRFYAEISRLREVVDLAREGLPTLFLLDELLSGTNSHDRRIGAGALVRGLVERGAIGMVTTHDLALADIVTTFTGQAANVHFEDYLEAGEIRFDYHLRQGVVTRSNALALMRAVGLEV